MRDKMEKDEYGSIDENVYVVVTTALTLRRIVMMSD